MKGLQRKSIDRGHTQAHDRSESHQNGGVRGEWIALPDGMRISTSCQQDQTPKEQYGRADQYSARQDDPDALLFGVPKLDDERQIQEGGGKHKQQGDSERDVHRTTGAQYRTKKGNSEETASKP